MNNDLSVERSLDILILGPMGDSGHEPSAIQIREALNSILDEPDVKSLLATHKFFTKNIHIPSGQNQPEIVQNILSLLDSTDLAVFDLTPKESNPDRANVFYELGLVHALGIPALLLIKDGFSVPFYARTTAQYRVPNFDAATIADALRSPMREFLDFENRTNSFVNDRVSQFYKLPIVDISAAVGLATGYYYNFLSRLLVEGGFISHYPELIKHVVYVRPSSIKSTYEADLTALKQELRRKGYELKTEKLPPLSSDEKGPLWFDHVNGIVLDIPRTIYPLRRSPRLLSFHERNQSFPSQGAERNFLHRLSQIEEHLLNRVQEAIKFQIRYDGPRVRSNILHFNTIENSPAMVEQLLN